MYTARAQFLSIMAMPPREEDLDEKQGQAVHTTDNDLLEAQIVAQAITELQEIQPAQTTQFIDPGAHITGQQSHILQTGDVAVGTDCEFEGELNNQGVTQVIYYIEDGASIRTDDRTLVDSGVQANDYDIERRSGRLPARKRVIPRKFRDYRNQSGDEGSDSDYEPMEYKPRPRKTPRIDRDPSTPASSTRGRISNAGRGSARGLGRPRKHYMPTHTKKGEMITRPGIMSLSSEVEEKFQAAVSAMTVLVDQNMEEEAAAQPTQKSVLEEAGDQGQDLEGNQSAENSSKGEHSDNPGGKDEDGTVVSENSSGDPLMTVAPKRGRGRPRGVLWKKYYKCPDCDKSFTQKGNLRVHLRVHTTERPFPCQEDGCNKAFRSNESLRRHLLSHQGIKPFECEICNNKFSSNVALSEHRSRHYDEKPHQCPHCQRMFRQVSCLRRHVMTHSKELPYLCNLCHKRFSQTAYLKSHMKVHTGEKPFRCDICDKRFAHQSDVKRHKTTHTGEKPYACTKCQARFSDVSSKRRHEKEHENSKRYTCHLCNDSFKRPGQLRSHLQRKHSHTFSVKIEKDPSSGVFMFKMGEEGDPNSVQVTQQRIVSLIKNLHLKTSTDGFPEIENLPIGNVQEIGNQSEEVALAASHVTDISQLDKEVDASVIENDIGVPIELQGVEIQGEEESGHTYIAVTELGDALQTADGKLVDGEQGECHYQIIQEITEDGRRQQILVPFNPNTVSSAPTDVGETVIHEHTTDSQIPEQITESQMHENKLDSQIQDNNELVHLNIDEAQVEEHVEESHGEEGQRGQETEKGQLQQEHLPQELITMDPIVNTEVNESTSIGVEDGSQSQDDVTAPPDPQTAQPEPQTAPPDPQTGVLYSDTIPQAVADSSIGNDADIVCTTEENIGSIAVVDDCKKRDAAANAKEDDATVNNVGNDSAIVELTEEVCPVSKIKDQSDIEPIEINVSTAETKESSSSTMDYVKHPDFSSQEYYNWLSNFTELCKVVPMPLDVSLFQKISQVHKTLSDVMATPSGVIADRENFQVLMNISKELNTIITEHLFFVMEKLNADGKDKDGNEVTHAKTDL